MDSKISLIIPVYKVPYNMLKKCIDSCVNQSFSNIEIILIDDESPDKCGELCDQYAKNDKRIKVVHQKNKGLSGARNTGVCTATSEWIMFIDGDDYIDYNMCETLINNSKSYKDLDIVCCGYKREKNNKCIICELTDIEEKLYQEEECKYLQEKILDFESHFSTAYCKMIKRKYLIENNIWHDEKLRQGAEGIEFNIRLFEKTKKVMVIKKYLYYYIYNESSISNKHNEKNHYYVLECFSNIKNKIEKSNNKEKLLELFYIRMSYVIVTTTISGYFSANDKETYKEKKRKCKKYLENPIIKDTFKNINYNKLEFKRKCIMMLISKKLYFLLNLIGKIKIFYK